MRLTLVYKRDIAKDKQRRDIGIGGCMYVVRRDQTILTETRAYREARAHIFVLLVVGHFQPAHQPASMVFVPPLSCLVDHHLK